ncbi:MAG: hypothetical protein AB1489_09020 [Acidobacteriota bacterium]
MSSVRASVINLPRQQILLSLLIVFSLILYPKSFLNWLQFSHSTFELSQAIELSQESDAASKLPVTNGKFCLESLSTTSKSKKDQQLYFLIVLISNALITPSSLGYAILLAYIIFYRFNGRFFSDCRAPPLFN